jgi:hypothetical protein
MRLRGKYLHRYQASRPTPSYLLPPVPRDVIGRAASDVEGDRQS